MSGLERDVGEVTRLLRAAREGDSAALERLIPMVYEDLRRHARWQLGQEYGERTLSPTALVHESYLKLGGAALAATSTPTWWAFWVVWKRVDSLTSACMRLP